MKWGGVLLLPEPSGSPGPGIFGDPQRASVSEGLRSEADCGIVILEEWDDTTPLVQEEAR